MGIMLKNLQTWLPPTAKLLGQKLSLNGKTFDHAEQPGTSSTQRRSARAIKLVEDYYKQRKSRRAAKSKSDADRLQSLAAAAEVPLGEFKLSKREVSLNLSQDPAVDTKKRKRPSDESDADNEHDDDQAQDADHDDDSEPEDQEVPGDADTIQSDDVSKGRSTSSSPENDEKHAATTPTPQ
jgi:hypothetical protein